MAVLFPRNYLEDTDDLILQSLVNVLTPNIQHYFQLDPFGSRNNFLFTPRCMLKESIISFVH